MNENNTGSNQGMLFKYTLSFSISSEPFQDNSETNAKDITKYEGNVELYKEMMIFMASGFITLSIPYRDIDFAKGSEYRLFLYISGKQYLKLFEIGYEYEDFLKNFFFLRNDIMIKDLMMSEKIIRSYVEGEFEEKDSKGDSIVSGECLIRINETGIVIVPKSSQIIRFPFGLIDSIESADYKIIIRLEDTGILTLSMLGYQFDSLKRDLENANDILIRKTQELIKEISVNEKPESIRQLSVLLKDGRAAKKTNVDSISPELWNLIEKKLSTQKVWDYYNFLGSISDSCKTCVGIKKGLFGNLTGYYLWFLFPILDKDSKFFTNTIALEAMTIAIPEDNINLQADGYILNSKKEFHIFAGQFVGEKTSETNNDESGEDSSGFLTGGRATYVFRMMDRLEFERYRKNGEELAMASPVISRYYDDFLRKANKCMLAINFRREPIYMTEEQLRLQSNISYRYAVNMLTELSWLRNIFVGRVIHRDKKMWKEDIKDILEFNVNCRDNFLKWQKK